LAFDLDLELSKAIAAAAARYGAARVAFGYTKSLGLCDIIAFTAQ